MLLDLVTLFVLYKIILFLFDDQRTALLGAFLWGTLLPLILTSELSLESEPIFTFFLAIAVLALLYGFSAGRARYWALAGVSFGAAALSRTSALYFPPLLVFFIALVPFTRFRRRLLNYGVLLASFLLVLTPWIVRNFLVFDAFVPGVTLNGYNLYRHNHILPDPDYLHYVYYPEMEAAQARLVEQHTDLRGDENEAEMDRVYLEEALKIIKAYPGRYLLLSLYRFVPLVTNYGVRYGLISDTVWNLTALGNLVFLVLALGSVIRRRAIQPRLLLPVLGLIGFYMLAYMLVNTRVRFIVPIMPYILALSADQLVSLALPSHALQPPHPAPITAIPKSRRN